MLKDASDELTTAFTVLSGAVAYTEANGRPQEFEGPNPLVSSTVDRLNMSCNRLSKNDSVVPYCLDAVRSLKELNTGIGLRHPEITRRDLDSIRAAIKAINNASRA